MTKSGLLCKEKARDVELVVQLEEWTDTTILQRSEEIRISLWVKVNTKYIFPCKYLLKYLSIVSISLFKSVIAPRDLRKETRRDDKGSRGQLKAGLKAYSNHLLIKDLKRRLRENLLSQDEIKEIKDIVSL